ncbi:MAG: cellulase family glycosylhydrolase, partial [Actinobacteria bacterium]|nr:cellulase family glycosylhydrolase [Actinomycetota bacterium]
FVRWDALEPSDNSYSSAGFAALDDFVARADAANKKVVLVVHGSPQWASGSSDYLVPPANPQKFGDFMGFLAARYAGRVQSWEIWNEPDEVAFWHGSTPGPAAYAPLLTASYGPIKAADPGAQVVAGPLTGNNFKFVEGLYALGAGNSFDAVGVHTDTACLVKGPSQFYFEPDGRIGRFSFLGFREVHAVMAAHGDGGKPITMSELGWSATTTRCARGGNAGLKDAGVGETNQARYLEQAYHCLAAYPYMTTGIWFNERDVGAADTELNRYGLIRWDATKRPSWDSLQTISIYGDQMTSSCGDLTPPTIKILEPTAVTRFDRGLYVAASASDSGSKLSSVHFYLNGKKFIGFAARNDQTVSFTLKDTSAVPYGVSTLKVRAVDKAGNTAIKELAITRVDSRELPRQTTRISLHLSGSQSLKTVRGRLTVPGTELMPTGKLMVRWQRYSRGRWVNRYARSKIGAAPFSYVQKISTPGRWRVLARYDGSGPFSRAQAVESLRVR